MFEEIHEGYGDNCYGRPPSPFIFSQQEKEQHRKNEEEHIVNMYFRKQVYQKQGHGDQAAC
jgi:hypothetical protein